MVYNAGGGGTGSGPGWYGAGAPVRGRQQEDDAGQLQGVACLQVATAVLEPGNAVLCVHSLLEHIDVTLTYDTEVFCDIYRCNFDT